MTMNTSQLYRITSYDEPHKVWKALCKHYELYPRKQYFRTRMSEETSIGKQIKCTKNKLAAIGAIGAIGRKTSSEDQVVTLLGRLPDSYSTPVTALEARAEENLDTSFAQQALLNEELKQNELK